MLGKFLRQNFLFHEFERQEMKRLYKRPPPKWGEKARGPLRFVYCIVGQLTLVYI